MRNLKFIVGFACTGFFLSLFFGIFSHSTFGRVFLQALIFLILFALVGFLIQTIYDKFLSDGRGSSEVIDSAGDVPDAGKKGAHVNLVIQDDELPASESENRFNVGENHQMLNESDFKVLQSADGGKFVPMQKESYDNLTETEAVTAQEISKKNRENGVSNEKLSDLPSEGLFGNESSKSGAAKVNAAGNKSTSTESKNSISSFSSDGDGLDTLPDMNDFSYTNQEEENEQDSARGFGTPSYSSSTGKSKSNEGIDPENASLMAKAISSILSGES